MKLDLFCEEIKKAYGGNLKSIVLYGSAVSGDHNKKYSDYNILIVVGLLGLDELKKIARVTNKWVKDGNPPPLMFTKDDIDRSSDVFPMEFLDIKESNRVLFGEDFFTGLAIDTKNLRLQCEHELRGKLIKLQESYILTEGTPKKVGELLVRSLSTFQVIFKTVLRLLKQQVPVQKKDATKMLINHLNIDGAVFDEILGLRENPKTLAVLDTNDVLKRYITQINNIIECVDKL